MAVVKEEADGAASGGEILLQKRKGTGFADGTWDFAASGHVEEGETMRQAAVRELMEETGLQAEPEFMGLIHSMGLDKNPRYLGVFKVTDYEGEPRVNEPEKCEEMKWFKLDDLPGEMFGNRKLALLNFDKKGFYLEYGW